MVAEAQGKRGAQRSPDPSPGLLSWAKNLSNSAVRMLSRANCCWITLGNARSLLQHQGRLAQAHFELSREGLFNLIKASPPSLKYEPGVVVADGEFVIVHGRFSGLGLPKNWIAADVVRIADGVLAEHWDVIEDEATRVESKSGLPMFGTQFTE